MPGSCLTIAWAFLFVCLAGFTPGAFAASCSTTDASISGSSVIGSATVQWNISCAQQTVKFTLLCPSTGWCALGFNADSSTMTRTDVVMANIVNNVPTVADCWSTGFSQPRADTAQGGTDDLTLTSGTTSGTINTYSWTRKLATADTSHDVSFSPGVALFLIVAVNTRSTNFASQHNVNPAASKIDIFVGSSNNNVIPGGSSKSALVAHAALMLLGWMVLVPVAQYIARYLKNLGHIWFLVHVGFNLGSLALVVIASIINVATYGTSVSAHAIFGIVIIILSVLQPILGAVAHRTYKPSRTSTPWFPDRTHWWLGRLLLLLVVAQCYVGFVAFGAAAGPYVTFGIGVVGMCALFALSEWRLGQIQHNATTFDKDELRAAGMAERARKNSKPLVGLAVFFVWSLLFCALTIALLNQ